MLKFEITVFIGEHVVNGYAIFIRVLKIDHVDLMRLFFELFRLPCIVLRIVMNFLYCSLNY